MNGCDSMISLNINKINTFDYENCESTLEILISYYYNYCKCNYFEDLKCPNCNKKGTLHSYKTYERNLSIMEGNEKKNIIITILVLKCDHCSKDKNNQKYHALLPSFVLPYHIHEASLIVESIYLRVIKKQKINEIIEKYQITHKLFYDWLIKMRMYLLPSSVVLQVNHKINVIIEKIYLLNEAFLMDFFDNYRHPFFLFKITCVPLCVTP